MFWPFVKFVKFYLSNNRVIFIILIFVILFANFVILSGFTFIFPFFTFCEFFVFLFILLVRFSSNLFLANSAVFCLLKKNVCSSSLMLFSLLASSSLSCLASSCLSFLLKKTLILFHYHHYFDLFFLFFLFF